MAQRNTYTNRCQRCNRQLKDPKAQYGWRCAEILGVAQNLNYAGDGAFNAYIVGMNEASAFLKSNKIDAKNIDLVKFYESFAKLYLASGMKNEYLYNLAYDDMLSALMPKRDKNGNLIFENSKAPSVEKMLNARDIEDYYSGAYSTTKYSNVKANSNVEFIQAFLNAMEVKDKFNKKLKTDGVFSGKTASALSKLSQLKEIGKKVTQSILFAENETIIESWDEDSLSPEEISQIYYYEEQAKAFIKNGDFVGSAYCELVIKSTRDKHYMSYQYTDAEGNTKIDPTKYNEFVNKAIIKNSVSASEEVPSYIIAGAIASQLDGPLPGIGDAAGLIVIVGGFLISQARAYFAQGKSNPHDLEKGMTTKQKEKYQREIENFKKGGGMPPDFNLPWPILKEIADEIKKMYK